MDLIDRQPDGRERTAAARAARTGAKHQRWAEELRAAGWKVQPPKTAMPALGDAVRAR